MPWVVYPTWSPRGDEIAFSEIDGAFHQGFLQWTKAQLYTVNRDGTGLHRIIKDEKAVAMESTWSPDSDQLIHTDFVIRPNQFSLCNSSKPISTAATPCNLRTKGTMTKRIGLTRRLRTLSSHNHSC